MHLQVNMYIKHSFALSTVKKTVAKLMCHNQWLLRINKYQIWKN